MSVNEAGRGRLVVLSGPSGSGKGTVLGRLLRQCRLPLVRSVSATTRAARSGEVNGRDYYFLTPEQFDQRRAAGEFLECAEVFGQWYGTLHSEVQQRLEAGQWVVLEIDVQGCQTVCRQYREAITIFLSTPSLDEYGARLRRRGTEDEQAIRRRVETAAHELTFADRYQHRVVNDDVDRAVAEICQILESVEASHHA